MEGDGGGSRPGCVRLSWDPPPLRPAAVPRLCPVPALVPPPSHGTCECWAVRARPPSCPPQVAGSWGPTPPASPLPDLPQAAHHSRQSLTLPAAAEALLAQVSPLPAGRRPASSLPSRLSFPKRASCFSFSISLLGLSPPAPILCAQPSSRLLPGAPGAPLSPGSSNLPFLLMPPRTCVSLLHISVFLSLRMVAIFSGVYFLEVASFLVLTSSLPSRFAENLMHGRNLVSAE